MEQINLGDKFIKLSSGLISKVLDKTSNSILMSVQKATPKGIDYTNWYSYSDFLKEFKPLYMKSKDLFTTGGAMFLIGLVSLIQAFFVLPLAFVPRVANFLLKGYGECISERDIQRYPVRFAITGWVLLYYMVAALSPLLLFFVPVDFSLSFLTLTIMFGFILWGMAAVLIVGESGHIWKSLTTVLRNFYKKALGLLPQNLTASEQLQN